MWEKVERPYDIDELSDGTLHEIILLLPPSMIWMKCAEFGTARLRGSSILTSQRITHGIFGIKLIVEP
jgi:hypothetical protein